MRKHDCFTSLSFTFSAWRCSLSSLVSLCCIWKRQWQGNRARHTLTLTLSYILPTTTEVVIILTAWILVIIGLKLELRNDSPTHFRLNTHSTVSWIVIDRYSFAVLRLFRITETWDAQAAITIHGVHTRSLKSNNAGHGRHDPIKVRDEASRDLETKAV